MLVKVSSMNSSKSYYLVTSYDNMDKFLPEEVLENNSIEEIDRSK